MTARFDRRRPAWAQQPDRVMADNVGTVDNPQSPVFVGEGECAASPSPATADAGRVPVKDTASAPDDEDWDGTVAEGLRLDDQIAVQAAEDRHTPGKGR